MENLETRFSVQYDINEKKSIRRKAEILELQIKDKSEDNINKIFPNQMNAVKKSVMLSRIEKSYLVLSSGMTKQGKLGV